MWLIERELVVLGMSGVTKESGHFERADGFEVEGAFAEFGDEKEWND